MKFFSRVSTLCVTNLHAPTSYQKFHADLPSLNSIKILINFQ